MNINNADHSMGRANQVNNLTQVLHDAKKDSY
jgi:hypothetical protein